MFTLNALQKVCSKCPHFKAHKVGGGCPSHMVDYFCEIRPPNSRAMGFYRTKANVFQSFEIPKDCSYELEHLMVKTLK